MKRRSTSVLAIDLGGTKIRSGLINEQYQVHDRRTVPTPKGGSDVVLNAILSLVYSYDRSQFASVAVGFAGVTSWPQGEVLTTPSIPGVTPFPIQRLLNIALRVPVVVDNDSTAWTLGEAIFGAGRGKDIVAGLILGTGVGGGLIINGHVYRGRHNATEFGHMTVLGGGQADRHGGPGHLEAYAGGWGIERAYYKHTKRKFSGAQIAAAARRGDRPARAIIAKAAYAVALGITNLYRIIDPDIIVLGGSVLNMPGLLTSIRQHVKTLIINPLYLDVPVVRARLGDDAPLVGAAYLARTS